MAHSLPMRNLTLKECKEVSSFPMPPELVFYCCIKQNHRFNDLKQYTHLLSEHFLGTGVWAQQAESPAQNLMVKLLSGLCSHVDVQLGKNPLPSLFRKLDNPFHYFFFN